MRQCARVIEAISTDAPMFTAVRRDIHAHPEIRFEEKRTADLIAGLLSEWGISVSRGMGGTGVVGTIQGGNPTRSIGLRADMDALPITELNTFAHASVSPGKMHACGHDGHSAMLLSAAKYLSQHHDFNGTVHVIFQPAEEDGGGAREMIKDGLFKRFPMEAIFGMHNWPALGVGQFAIKSGPVLSSANDFRITVHGKGTHAAMPHLGVDPVVAACQMVQAFSTIVTRNKRPIDAAVISVTMIHAGETCNVGPESCEIRGVVRTFSAEVLELIERRMRQIAVATCDAFEARCTFDFRRNYPSTVNSQKESDFVRRVLVEAVGVENVKEFEPTMGSEDFSFYLLENPGCYFVIGNGDDTHRLSGHGDGPCVLHNPSYDFNDDLIPIGGSVWVQLVQRWFSNDDGLSGRVTD